VKPASPGVTQSQSIGDKGVAPVLAQAKRP
jgi:hypothetical protein